MLDKYLTKLLKDDREAHPISEEDFDAWRNNRITKRFFTDISVDLIRDLDEIGGNTIDECAMSAAQFKAIREFYEHDVLGWKPEEIESD